MIFVTEAIKIYSRSSKSKRENTEKRTLPKKTGKRIVLLDKTGKPGYIPPKQFDIQI